MELSSFTAKQIASEADCSTREGYESELDYYQQREYTYIPMPEDGRYYHVGMGELCEIDSNQYVEPDTEILTVFSILEKYDFALIDWYENLVTGDSAVYIADQLDGADASELAMEVLEDAEAVRERYPDDDVIDDFIFAIKSTNELRYSIITLADVNKRRARELFYRVFSEFEVLLSTLVENEYPDSTSLFYDASPEAIGRWQKSKIDDLVVHISEHMYLSTLMDIVGKSQSLRREFGYESRSQFKKDLGGLIQLRNRIMHPTKTLVHDTEDLSKTISRLQRAINAVDEFHRDETESEFPIPDAGTKLLYSG
ncbi:hypothetical protein [Halomarina rubra]|uniref:Apea-like HEPN domain-containing protein n=1 Tax=Halomarina rubra TaxID=2071873 RepID=A0ABD6AV48_9EURY|nr:hypothetical protein [Halomarina rubra]